MCWETGLITDSRKADEISEINYSTGAKLQIPLTNLTRFGDRAFCAYAPHLRNELPDNIKAADSVQNFKKQLKTLLFRKEFI